MLYHPNKRDEIRRAYLQKEESIKQGGDEAFSSTGFRSWHKKKRLKVHVGGPNSIHNQAKKKCEDLMRQEQSIQTAFVKQSNQTKLEYRIRLNASVNVVRLLLTQGFAFRGHREDESSSNKGGVHAGTKAAAIACVTSAIPTRESILVMSAPFVSTLFAAVCLCAFATKESFLQRNSM